MRMGQLLHRTFQEAAEHLDKRNHKTIIESALTLSEHRHLSIAAIGRALKSPAKVKHNIKRVDRLFGNLSVQNSGVHYYRQMAAILVKAGSRPVISVDWSGLTPCGTFYLLRASIPVGGRAMTLLEGSYVRKEYTKRQVHQNFLNSLNKILPNNCKPIIVADAGFRCTWFKLVLALGWDFVGRIRNTTYCRGSDVKCWLPVKSFYKLATSKPTYLFEAEVAKGNAVEGSCYLYKAPKKHRIRKNLAGKKVQKSQSLKHAAKEDEPWFLFTSLLPSEFKAKEVVKIYAERMQIEEAFRDLKNARNGLGLRHCRSFSKGRLNVALLLAAIANFVLWILGLIAKNKGIHHSFQANTTKKRSVLSVFTIGWQYLKRNGARVKKKDYENAIRKIQSDASFFPSNS